MDVRLAKQSDLSRCLEVYEIARQIMRDSGNDQQWINGYPSRELLEKDVEKGNLYVIEDEQGIHGVFAFILGEDPTYKVIEGGKWLNEEPYGTIHRIGSDKTVRGIMETAVSFCRKRVKNVRADTHELNKIMQHNLKKQGFVYCGVIHIEDGSPRVAYMLSEDSYED